MPLFEGRPNLLDQSFTLRHVRVDSNEVFGGGGVDLGALATCKKSTLLIEYIEATDNTQKGIGAGAIFSEGCDVTVAGSVFQNTRNLGLGAGALYAFAGSTVDISYTQFTDGARARHCLRCRSLGACTGQ